MGPARSSKWEDACLAAALLAVDPVGIGGISLRCSPGPVRDRWWDEVLRVIPSASRVHPVPLHIDDTRLLGGLDLAATLRAGRPIAQQGILAACDGGILRLSMAERVPHGTVARIVAVLDSHEVLLEREGFTRRVPSRFAVIALDEGIEPDERPAQALLDRVSLHLDLNDVPLRATAPGNNTRRHVIAARGMLRDVRSEDAVLVAICESAVALGIDSARPALLTLRVARALAALAGRREVSEEDAVCAARLVLAPRATQLPATEVAASAQTSQPPAQTEPAPTDSTIPDSAPPEMRPASADSTVGRDAATSGEQSAAPTAGQTGSLGERVLAATKAALPLELLAGLNPDSPRASASSQTSRKGSERASLLRGRPYGAQPGDPRRGRVSVIETLRAAAPWQRLRRLERDAPTQPGVPSRIWVHREDFRVKRFRQRRRATTIFLVDASGSAALNRLGEVKGAVELMLGESYLRRNRVALIAFRGTSAQLLLPPTASLVRAKRELANLPGGGGTPLALGLDAARVLADSLRTRGETSTVVVLTDGHPNIARDGKGGRVRATADAVSAARLMRDRSICSLLLDTAPQPRLQTESFAREMGARYVPLPFANSRMLIDVVRAHHAPGSAQLCGA